MNEEFGQDTESVGSSRMPPHSVEAEQSVLGSLMLDERAWETVSETLLDTDYYRHDHRIIFSESSKQNRTSTRGRSS